ncbi:MAG: helix-turn-helix transcriptional regulator [Gammaproteobacteria bacterium]|nr:helix-turn-helix transcriptional regulator [Gammaproteobacteria bacterium]
MTKQNLIPVRLKEARNNAQLTQKDLGLRIGIDFNSASARMNHYEKGRHTPDIDTLQRIADALGVPLNYFFCESTYTAELACLIAKLNDVQKLAFIKELSLKINTDQ